VKVNLCVSRGDGPEVCDITLWQESSGLGVPNGFLPLKHTPFGSEADLRGNSKTADGDSKNPLLYLCLSVSLKKVFKW